MKFIKNLKNKEAEKKKTGIFQKKQIHNKTSEKNNVDSEKKRLMEITHYIGDNAKKIAIIIFVILLFIFNFALNTIIKMFSIAKLNAQKTMETNSFTGEYKTQIADNLKNNAEKTISDTISIVNFFYIDFRFIFMYLIIFLIAAFLSLKLYFNIQSSFKDFNVYQKGSSRWTTREEIKEQYKKVPIKTHEYEGKGGLIVAEDDSFAYVDDSPSNNLYIGTTRSGKGEMFVFKLLDILSRGMSKPSMIFNDPKLEIAHASIKTLEKRGYECHILNLIDLNYSMGYNPLSIIMDLYKEGNVEQAEQLTSSFSTSIFEKSAEGSKDKFWTNQATFLFSALIIAHISDAIKKDEMLERIRNIKVKKEIRKTRESLEKRWLNENIDSLYETVDLKEKKIGFKIKNYIIENKLNLSLNSDISKLKEKFSLNETAFKKALELIDELPDFNLSAKEEYKKNNDEYDKKITTNQDKVNITSVVSLFSALASDNLVEEYFKQRPASDRARLLFASANLAGENTQGGIYSTMLTELQLFVYESIAKLTAKSSFDMKKIGFGKKPIAIFLGLPDYDTSNHFIASIFISQVYFTLSKFATSIPGGKIPREVHFILDEFGNMPAVPKMDSTITVNLGRGIRFHLFIQGYSQVYEKYGEKAAETIIGSCANQIFILTNDKKTAEDFSALLGKETITDITRSGENLSLKQSFNESKIESPLMRPDDLMSLKEGECVIKRVIKRTDLKGNKIKPYPILNTGKNRLKYRYEYLLDDFPQGVLLYNNNEIDKVNNMYEEATGKKIEKVPCQVETRDEIDLKKDIINLEERIKEVKKYKKSLLVFFKNIPPESIAILSEIYYDGDSHRLENEFDNLLMQVENSDIKINSITNFKLSDIKNDIDRKFKDGEIDETKYENALVVFFNIIESDYD